MYAFYSTPACYAYAINRERAANWSVKTDDFFPYALRSCVLAFITHFIPFHTRIYCTTHILILILVRSQAGISHIHTSLLR